MTKEKGTNNEHDGSYKQLFSHPEMVESLIREFVPEDWVEGLDFSSLENTNKSFTTDDIRPRADDSIWRVRWNESWVYVYLLIEFQSTVDPWMPVRVSVYTGLLYQDLIKSKKVKRGEQLPPVFPIVLYNGQNRWTARQDIADLIAPMPPSLARYRPSHRYFLVDEGKVPMETLGANSGLANLLIRLERSNGPEELQTAVKDLIEHVKEPKYLSLRRAFTVWIRRVILRRMVLEEPIPEVADLQEVDNMLAERVTQWTEKWKREGRVEGRVEGMQENAQRMLLKALKMRFGAVNFQIVGRVNAVHSQETLDRLFERALQCSSIDEFEADLVAATDN